MDALKDALKVVKLPLHKEGNMYVLVSSILSFVGFFINGYLGIFLSIISLWVAYFFRDPVRVVPQQEGLVISPADGVVQKIEKVAPPEGLGMDDTPLTRVSIFMNVFNVHVNRIPIEGKVVEMKYHEGTFISTLDKESDKNERNALRVDTPDGKSFAVVQIAGLIARRIVCNVEKGHHAKTGERFGIIKFGSRVDVYLPEGVIPSVIVGQQAVAGETIIADVHAEPKDVIGVAI